MPARATSGRESPPRCTSRCGLSSGIARPWARKSADRFKDLPRDELGDDAWREAGFDGDIWYATVHHFAADIAHPAEMVEWVEQRRGLDLGQTTTDVAELVRFRYEDGPDGRVMRPEVLAAARIGGGSAAVPQPTTRSVDS